MNLNQFLQNQEKNYNEIRNLQRLVVEEKGIEPDPALVERRGGFFIVLIHSTVITRKAMRFSREVSKRAPAIVYGSTHVHTTLGRCTFGFGPQFYFNAHTDKKGAGILRKLSDVISNISETIPRNALEINYTEYLLTPHSLIAAGTPNEVFVKMLNLMIEEGKRRNIEINPPWGAHITLSRFTERRTLREMSPVLSTQLGKAAPFGRSAPIGIAAGYTFREPKERHFVDLRKTPGHFRPYKVFLFPK